MSKKKKILVAPLDWGLGHATRCVPVIRELLKQDAEVIIAGDGRSFALLQEEFPQLEFLKLKGYNITYGKPFIISMLLQIPKIRYAIYREQRELQSIIKEKRIDAVISDNRYGLFTGKIPCVFITHQTGIIMPAGFKWAEKMINHFNKRFITKYTQCWVPDFEGKENLSGILSHKYPATANTHFVGPLSRFEAKQEGVQKKYDVLVILSGPEPQRTILEGLLMEQLKSSALKVFIVRGMPEQREASVQQLFDSATTQMAVTGFLNARQLNEMILSSDILISRSGYSTIMDLAVLGKRAILIPTPGQTEQEYLATYFSERKIFYTEKQEKLNLQNALRECATYSGITIKTENNLLPRKISELLNLVS